jgi:hypothetical protein
MIGLKDFESCKSFESAYIIENYPYGFKRTKKAIWIDRKGKKERVGERTLNPKTNEWNNIKYSTYSDLVLLFKQQNGFIKTYHFNLQYSDLKDFNELLEFLGDYTNDYIENLKKLCKAVYKTQEFVSVEFNNVTNQTKEEKEKHEIEQRKVKNDINKLFVRNALNEGLTLEDLKK